MASPPVTILLIDDEPGFVSALARLLRHDGHTVDTAADGRAALTHLQAQRYVWFDRIRGFFLTFGDGLYRIIGR
jgi:CheY-like chemotaxis protein